MTSRSMTPTRRDTMQSRKDSMSSAITPIGSNAAAQTPRGRGSTASSNSSSFFSNFTPQSPVTPRASSVTRTSRGMASPRALNRVGAAMQTPRGGPLPGVLTLRVVSTGCGCELEKCSSFSLNNRTLHSTNKPGINVVALTMQGRMLLAANFDSALDRGAEASMVDLLEQLPQSTIVMISLAARKAASSVHRLLRPGGYSEPVTFSDIDLQMAMRGLGGAVAGDLDGAPYVFMAVKGEPCAGAFERSGTPEQEAPLDVTFRLLPKDREMVLMGLSVQSASWNVEQDAHSAFHVNGRRLRGAPDKAGLNLVAIDTAGKVLHSDTYDIVRNNAAGFRMDADIRSLDDGAILMLSAKSVPEGTQHRFNRATKACLERLGGKLNGLQDGAPYILVCVKGDSTAGVFEKVGFPEQKVPLELSASLHTAEETVSAMFCLMVRATDVSCHFHLDGVDLNGPDWKGYNVLAVSTKGEVVLSGICNTGKVLMGVLHKIPNGAIVMISAKEIKDPVDDVATLALQSLGSIQTVLECRAPYVLIAVKGDRGAGVFEHMGSRDGLNAVEITTWINAKEGSLVGSTMDRNASKRSISFHNTVSSRRTESITSFSSIRNALAGASTTPLLSARDDAVQ